MYTKRTIHQVNSYYYIIGDLNEHQNVTFQTQASSPAGESLSVKASQKVYKTYSPTQQSTFTSPGRNQYTRVIHEHLTVIIIII